MPPRYDPEIVRPMWEELAQVGMRPLTTPEEVDSVLGSQQEGVVLLAINSVCGCAAGSFRPGLMLALQNEVIPDTLVTVFAGVDTEATERARSYLQGFPPSSPSLFLFKNGEVVFALHRSDIETLTPLEIATRLTEVFNRECTARGPSIPREDFERILPVQVCGSSIPLYTGH